MTDLAETPAARALRALQKLDACSDFDNTADGYHLLVEAQDALGEALGLECTGIPDNYFVRVPGGPDEERRGYDHGKIPGAYRTCPIHEWLVPSDHEEVEEWLAR